MSETAQHSFVLVRDMEIPATVVRDVDLRDRDITATCAIRNNVDFDKTLK